VIAIGYGRDHHPERAGGAGRLVPLDYCLLAANVADRTTPMENLRRRRQLLVLLPSRSPAGPGPLVISDWAMLTTEAVAA